MALSVLEETQLRELLINFDGLNDVGTDANELIASLLAGDVVVTDLPVADPLHVADTLYVAQAGADVKATIQQLTEFMIPLLPIPASGAKLYYMGQI